MVIGQLNRPKTEGMAAFLPKTASGLRRSRQTGLVCSQLKLISHADDFLSISRDNSGCGQVCAGQDFMGLETSASVGDMRWAIYDRLSLPSVRQASTGYKSACQGLHDLQTKRQTHTAFARTHQHSSLRLVLALCMQGLAPQWSATRYGGPGYSSGPIKSFSASKSQAKALEPPLRSYTPGRGAFLPWRVRRGYRFHNLLKTCQKKSRPGRSPQVFVKSAGNPEDFDILAAASR